MGSLTAPPALPDSPGTAQALFAAARQRRRRRWLAGITAVLAASAVVAAVTVIWLHRASGQDVEHPGAAGVAVAARASGVAAVWFDGTRLRTGDIYPSGRVTQRAGPEASADLLPLVQAGGRVYWVNAMGAFVPSRPYMAWYPRVVQYLDRATGKTGTVGPGSTAFLSANRRFLLMAQDATTLAEMPVAGGTLRQLTLPRGWYLPGGDGQAGLGYSGLATANGVIVQSGESTSWHPQVLAVWNPARGQVKVLGRGLTVLGAYTPPGARYSLLAWLPAACRFPDNCLLKITNTTTLATRTIRSPLPGGFAAGGAFSPGGTQLAVFLNAARGPGRLALVDVDTGTVRIARTPGLVFGMDIGWALWLPDGRHLIGGTGAASYLVNSATLSASPLSLAHTRDRTTADSQNINFTAAILPPRRLSSLPALAALLLWSVYLDRSHVADATPTDG